MAEIREKVDKRAGALLIFSDQEDIVSNSQISSQANQINEKLFQGNVPIHVFLLDESETRSSMYSGLNVCSDLGTTQSIHNVEGTVWAGLIFQRISQPKGWPLTTNQVEASILINSGLKQTDRTMTMVRAIYSAPKKLSNAEDEYTSHRTELIGIVGIDFNLYKIKEVLDEISEDIGKISFPVLLTPAGETIYHMLQNVYKAREPIDLGRDISNYEYFDGFRKHVREPCLKGEVGSKSTIVHRAIPAGDAATEGFQGMDIQTTYFYTPVPSYDLRILIVYDAFDLVSVDYRQSTKSFL
jgi:hypothetical protein